MDISGNRDANANGELPPDWEIGFLERECGAVVLAVRAALAARVKSLHPRDLPAWPLLLGVRFWCFHSAPPTFVVLVLIPTMVAHAIVGPENGLQKLGEDATAIPDCNSHESLTAWLDIERRRLRVGDEAGLFLLPLDWVVAAVQALNRGHPPTSNPLLDLQIADNMAHHRRFLRIETAVPEEWRGPPMSAAQVGALMGISGNALRKRCARAGDGSSPYHALRPGGPGRFPGGKFREDAVRYVVEQLARAPEIAKQAVQERLAAVRAARSRNPVSPAALEREGMRALDGLP